MAAALHLLDGGAAVVHQVRRHGNHQVHVLRVRSHHFSKEARYILAAIGVEVRLLPEERHAVPVQKKIVGGGGGERDSVDMEKKKHKLGTYSYGNTAVLPLNLEKSCTQCEREGVSSSSAVRSALDTVHGFVASHSSAKDY